MSKDKSAGLKERIQAADILYKILHDRISLDDALGDVLDRAGVETASRDRGFVKAMSAQTLRRLGEIDMILFRHIKHKNPLKDNYVLMILRSAVAQLLFMRVPVYAVIDCAVQAAKQHKQASVFADLVNAVLRVIAKEEYQGFDLARLNVPSWLWRRWVKHYGKTRAEKIIKAHYDEPPLDLSFTNDRPVLSGDRLGQRSVRLWRSGKVKNLIGYDEGRWWVQDIAASLAVRLLGDIKSRSVLEFCAAPGGKTAQCISLGASVCAIEISASRAALWQENMRRLGFSADLHITDGSSYQAERFFSLILLDAPCSGTGSCRHNPDLVWRRKEHEIKRLAKQQRGLLESAYRNLARGGVLVYSVCSLEPEEGIEIINHFLNKYKDMRRAPIRAEEIDWMSNILTSAGDIASLPFHAPNIWQAAHGGRKRDETCIEHALGGMDGFYVARLIRADG